MDATQALATAVSAAAMLVAGTIAPAAVAQQNLGPPIIIVGQRAVLGIIPERTLGQDEVSAYGAATIGELLDLVTAEEGETPDQPVILVNGERVANLSDIDAFPPESVSQLQVLPRGSAQRFGEAASARVYNVVLKPNSQSFIGRSSVRAATEGGWTRSAGDIAYTKINGSRRLNGFVRLRSEDMLRESERRVIQPEGSPADLARFRTLLPSVRSLELGGSASGRLTSWMTGTLAGRFSASRRRALLGRAPSGEAMQQTNRATMGHLDLSLNATPGSWLITFIGTYDRDRRRTGTDRASGRSASLSRLSSADADLTATGPLARLPAGHLRLTIGASLERTLIGGEHEAGETRTRERFRENSQSVSASIEIPIASRAHHFLPALGELTGSAQVTRTRVSHFGALISQTYSLAWQPAAWLRLFGSLTTGRTPPDARLVAEPLLATPGVRYFDPLRSETVDVIEISGGNPDLRNQQGQTRHLAATIKPAKSIPLRFTAEYTKVRNRHVVTALPPASDLILLAFPERFGRDPLTGVLTDVDVRPVQLARESHDQFRQAVNLNLPLGGRNIPARGAASNGSSAASMHPRLLFNLSHSWLFKREVVLIDGDQPIDLLSRNAIGFAGGRSPRHQVDASLGYSERGLGVRLSGQYRSKSFLRLAGAGASEVLRFAPMATFSLRAWVEPSRFADRAWLEGARLTLSVSNVTDQRQKVMDRSGATPLAYQRAYRDPLGRTIEIELRKSF